MDYAKLITSSWEFTKENKAVIWFGLLMSLGSFVSLFNDEWLPSEYPGLILIVQCAVFLAILWTLIIDTWAQAAVIHFILQNDNDHEENKSALHESNDFALVRQYLALARNDISRLIKLYLVATLILIIPIFIGAILYLLQAYTGNIPFIILAIVFIPIILVGLTVVDQSVVALVSEDLSVSSSLRRGWQVVMDNLGVYIAVGLITWLLFGLIRIAIRGTVMAFQYLLPETTHLMIAILSFPVWVIFYSNYNGFYSVVYTRVFLQLTQPAETD